MANRFKQIMKRDEGDIDKIDFDSFGIEDIAKMPNEY